MGPAETGETEMMSKSDKLDGKFELTFYGSAVAVK